MGLGLKINSGSKDFLPIIKYDARAGRVFRVDRADGVSTPVDITKKFKAVFDFENVEVGYINFATGSAPDFVMVSLGSVLPASPSENHKQGMRMVVKLHESCGGDCRELAGTSGAFLASMEKLHDEYLAGLVNNAGKLPVVTLADTVAIESGSGARKSTNYRPVFEITGWVNRPKDLVASPRDSESAAAAPAKVTPPSTGSSRAPPPVARTPEPAMAEDEDFG
jgi:hypothetical protein